MPKANTVDELMGLAARRFKKDAATLLPGGDVFESLGVDSMRVEIPDYELREVRTFAQLAACIDRRL
jgi:hypothetical protein